MKKTLILIVLFFLLPLCMDSIALQSGYDLFQKALVLERADGKLQEAIALYQKVVDESGDKSISAKAQFRIGMCYEKLGLRDAQIAYQKVIDNYPQEQEEVRAARERIAALAKTLAAGLDTPRFRKITIPANPGNGVLSPDGKRLAFASEGSIWVVPVSGNVDPDIAGAPVRLTEPMEAQNGYNTLAWSGDGKWIAFHALPERVYVIPSTGGKVKEVAGARASAITRLSLSPDGKLLAFHDDEAIYTVPIDGGKVLRLVEGTPRYNAENPAFSPDGKNLTYVKKSFDEDKAFHHDIWVIPIAGGAPRKIVSDAEGVGRGPVLGPFWSTDGKMIIYLVGNGNDVWIAGVGQEGSQRIEPKKIRLPLTPGNLFPAGWTSQGTFGLHLVKEPHVAVYTVPASGGRASQVSPDALDLSHTRWSSDRKRIFFRKGGGILSIPSSGGTEETLLPPYKPGSDQIIEATPGGGNNISPDGKMLVFSGGRYIPKKGERDYQLEVNIYTLPVDGGKPKQITSLLWNPDVPRANQDRFPCWSPDGSSIAFIRDIQRGKDEPHEINVFTIASDGSEPRQITSNADEVAWATIDWTPDGKHIAYFSQEKTINLVPSEGGLSRTIIKVDEIHPHWELSWSPDGKEIAYACNGRIWRVPFQGGQPVEVKTGLDSKVGNLAWSPDGYTIAFTAWNMTPDLYLMENF
jgi:Tol biopolymer transport system component